MPFENTLVDRLKSLEIRDTANDARYHDTYPLFLDFFRTRIAVPDLNPNDAKIAVTLVYTWMGRAKLNTASCKNFKKAERALKCLASHELNVDELEIIKSFVGDSLIATSKFLHFFEPTRFAIWDQHVARGGYGFRHYAQYNKPSIYLTYLTDLRALVLPQFVRDKIHNAIGQVSDLRVKEFALFHLGIMNQ